MPDIWIGSICCNVASRGECTRPLAYRFVAKDARDVESLELEVVDEERRLEADEIDDLRVALRVSVLEELRQQRHENIRLW